MGTFGQFNLKISLHWSVQISTFEAYIPPTIYSHRFSHPYYTHCDLENKPVGRHFYNSLKLGPTFRRSQSEDFPAKYQIRPYSPLLYTIRTWNFLCILK